MLFGGGSHTDMLIDYNQFQDQGESTLYFQGGPYDRLHIEYNKFNGAGNGVFWAASQLVDGVVKGNEFDGMVGGSRVGGPGLNIGQGGNLVIEDNHFHDMSYAALQVGLDGGQILDNTFDHIENPYAGYDGADIQLWGGEYGTAVSTNVTISGNLLSYNDVAGSLGAANAIRLRSPDSPPNGSIDASTIHINDNSFLDSGASVNGGIAIVNNGDPTKTIDASANWWGTTDATIIPTLVSGSEVDFTPYLNSGTNSATNTGFQGDFSVLNVTATHGQVGVDRPHSRSGQSGDQRRHGERRRRYVRRRRSYR